jgi:hypothetical protein
MAKPQDINLLQRTIEMLLERHPELSEDEDLRADMLEGSTTFRETIEKVLRHVQDNIYLANACREAERDIHARRIRFEKRVEIGREMMKVLMEAADLRKLEFPTGTVSVMNTAPQVVVLNEYEIPDDFMRIKKEPNKVLLKEVLEKMDVPGVTLSNGGTALVIRGA